MAKVFWLLWGIACQDAKNEEVKDVQEQLLLASETVIFASAEQLGPHKLQTVYAQQEYHGEDVRTSSKEIVDMDWVDWDNWHAKRMVDEEIVSNVWIVAGKTIEQQGKNYVEQADGEPYRVQLRSTSSQWDSVIRAFQPYIVWEFQAKQDMDGRVVHMYTAKFTEPDVKKMGVHPLRFQGTVWVDEQTAVRLLGKIEMTVVQGSYKKDIQFQVQRSDIQSSGVLQRIVSSNPL